MGKVNFDRYADEYNEILQGQLNFFDGHTDYFAEYKVEIVRKEVGIYPKRILEYGCGIGRNLRFLKEKFPNSQIYACDISSKSLELVQSHNPSINFFLAGKDTINKEFDLVFIAGVFHHIAPESRIDSMQRIYKLLNDGGELFVFEHNPYNPITLYLVNTSPFDFDAVLLTPKILRRLHEASGFAVKNIQFTLFFPSFLKKMRFLEKYIGFVPLGGQYYIHSIKK